MAASDWLEETRPEGHGRARGLVSARASGARVHARSFLPSEDLRGFVSRYWTGSWDLRGQQPHVTEMLGDPCVHIVFERGPSGTSSRLVGVWTRLWRRKLEGLGSVRGIKMHPGALRVVLDTPVAQFNNRIVPLTDVFPEAASLEPNVLGPDDDAAAFGVLEAWLRQRTARIADPQIQRAVSLVERVAACPEMTTAKQLSDDSGVPLRALQRLFRQYVGASPKWVIRRNRLQEVALRIEKGEAHNLASLAAELGYSDQAHLARDFKSVVGKTPSQFSNDVQ